MSKFEIIRQIPNLNLYIFTQSNQIPFVYKLLYKINEICQTAKKTEIVVSFASKQSAYTAPVGNLTDNSNGVNFITNLECYSLHDKIKADAFLVFTQIGNIFVINPKYQVNPDIISEMSMFKSYVHRTCETGKCINYSMISELMILYHVIICVVIANCTAHFDIDEVIRVLVPQETHKKIFNIIIEICAKIYMRMPYKSNICYVCTRSSDTKFNTCARCMKYWYCSRECQKIHWTTYHKYECMSYTPNESDPSNTATASDTSDTSASSASSASSGINNNTYNNTHAFHHALYTRYKILFRDLLNIFIENMLNIKSDEFNKADLIEADLD